MGFGALRYITRPLSRTLISRTSTSTATLLAAVAAGSPSPKSELRSIIGASFGHQAPWFPISSHFHSLTDTRFPKRRPSDKPGRKRGSLRPPGPYKLVPYVPGEPIAAKPNEGSVKRRNAKKRIRQRLAFILIHPNAARFRTRGIEPLLEEKLNRMFMNTVATGVYAWTPSSGQVPCESDKGENDKSSLPEQLESSGESGEPIRSELAQARKNKRSIERDERQNKVKKGKGNVKVGGAAKLSQQIDHLVDIVESRSTGSSIAPSDTGNCSMAKVVEVLDSLPGLQTGSELYFFSVHLLLDKCKRDAFMAFKEPEVKLNWLKMHDQHDRHFQEVEANLDVFAYEEHQLEDNVEEDEASPSQEMVEVRDQIATSFARNERREWKFGNCLSSSREKRGYLGSSAERGIRNEVGFQVRCFGSATSLIQRNPSFSTLNTDDINYFKGLVGEKNVIQDEDRLLTANTDWMHKYRGSSKLLLQPRTTEEVAQILKYCNSRCLAVVPQGGNTGLVGGSVPVFDEVIINLGLMNNIVSFDKVSGILVCEAGCILENLITFLDTQGFIMPLDLGAKGSCQIGGNVSTNAGGLRLVRYGSLHGTVLGLEAVLANGDVLDMLGTLRKDNTGYDLKHLFIDVANAASDLYCQNVYQKLLVEAKRKLGEILSAFEFLDNLAMDLVLNHLEGVRNPLPPFLHNFYVLIETTGSHESYDREKLEAFLLHAMEVGLISDGALAQDINQASSFWHIREVSFTFRFSLVAFPFSF
ncbi:D-2-hydroxyglutarate dehydrogenase [Morus notabilis]|uniref:D-2-hydroxyglutarate dehydrogenase n=1 Tax=Morus notabilis TaxID=981085 RepID=W9S3T7_9ROSA|nr:D-2-hydroxyglutarate dehydrogenase [Morus notabilis]